MKHSIARHALIAMASALGSTCALAQSSVTIYGIADIYMQAARVNGDTTARLESGGESGSRLGFRGQEDLGAGLRGIFALETGIGLDNGGVTQGGVMWGRQAYVGLSGNSIGSLTLGRQYSLLFSAVDNSDPFSTGLGSAFSSGIVSTLGGARMNNSVLYTSPKFGPVTVGVQGALGEATTGRQWATNVRVASGPFTLEGVYTSKQAFGNQVTGRAALLGGTYDLGFMKMFGEVQTVKNLTQAVAVDDDRTEIMLGAQVPFGPHRITAGVGTSKVKNVSGSRAKEFSLGYQYAMSKRTDLYVIGSAIDNGSATAYTANGATGSAPTPLAGGDVRAVQVGMRHRF